jgi:hypothetical protein
MFGRPDGRRSIRTRHDDPGAIVRFLSIMTPEDEVQSRCYALAERSDLRAARLICKLIIASPLHQIAQHASTTSRIVPP